MLPGFFPQSTPPASPPAGGALPAASGGDTFNAGAGREAFTSALDSACDAQSTCADAAQSHSTDKPGAGTSPGLAAWLLALARGANPPGEAVANEHATQQAPPFSEEGDVALPVSGDSEEAEDAFVAQAESAADPTVAVIVASGVDGTPVADPTLSQAIATSLTEHSDDNAMAVGDGSVEAAETSGARGRQLAPEDASRDGLSASDRDAQVSRGKRTSRPEQERPSNDAGTTTEAIAAAAEPVDGVDLASDTSAAVDRAQSQASASDGLETADRRGADGRRPPSAGSADHVSSASPGAAAATAAVTEPATVATSAGPQTAQADATAAWTETGDARSVTKLLNAAADHAPKDASHRSVSSATAADDGSHSDDSQGSVSQIGVSQIGVSQSGVSQGGAFDGGGFEGGGFEGGGFEGGGSSRDSWRQSQDGEGSARHRGLDVAGTRSAAAALLTLVAGPDGALRLTPAAMASPVLAPILPQDQTANLDQLVQTMRVMVKEQVTEATVHLRPRHFGEVSIQVRVDGKSVSAIIQTDSSQVRDWMLGQESTLRNGLSEQGLQLERLVVQRDGRQDRRDHSQQQPERRRQRQRPQSESQQTFELSA